MGEPEPVATHFSSVKLPNGSNENMCGPVSSTPPTRTWAINGARRAENSRFAMSLAAEFIGIGRLVSSLYSCAFALRMSTVRCASATLPEMVIARWLSILYTFFPFLWATKYPIVTRVSEARMTPFLQITPIVVVPFSVERSGFCCICCSSRIIVCSQEIFSGEVRMMYSWSVCIKTLRYFFVFVVVCEKLTF